MLINTKFDIGEIVYLRTDPDQLKRIITEIIISQKNQEVYRVALVETESSHYEFEMSRERDVLLTTTN